MENIIEEEMGKGSKRDGKGIGTKLEQEMWAKGKQASNEIDAEIIGEKSSLLEWMAIGEK